jgi:3-dehydroquinate synthase
MQTFDVSFRESSRRTRVRVGRGALAPLPAELAAAVPGARLALVSDDRVMPLHGRRLAARLQAAGLAVECFEFPAGESGKTRAAKAVLEDAFLARGIGRDAAVLAVGGGVTGDLAGYLAATWHRGIPVVQVPTSVLAMVDASIGGKTGVNLAGAKNVVGAFHQPLAIYADTTVLETLPDRDFRAGFAEVVKVALIGDGSLFDTLEGSVDELLGRDAETLDLVIGVAMRIKAAVVVRDEREGGARAALNFGHTVGHALEVCSGFALSHGEAVATGMVVEADLAAAVHDFPQEGVRRLAELLRRLGLPTVVPATLETDALFRAMRLDKKTRGGEIRYALPVAPGAMPAAPATSVEVSDRLVAAAIERRKG